MIQRYMRFFVIILIGLSFIFVTLFGLRLLKPNKGYVTLENSSNFSILGGTIDICNKSYVIPELQPGQKKLIQFDIKGDSDYKISVQTASKKTMSKRLGYITNGCTNNDILQIKNDTIFLKANCKIE